MKKIVKPTKGGAGAKQPAAPAKKMPAPSTAVAAPRTPEARQIPGPMTAAQKLLAEDSGSGLETVQATDLAIPRITIIQGISPQVQRGKTEYMEEAEVGMIFDPVTGNLYDGTEGVLMVFVSFRGTNLRWWPRNSSKGKGFIADLGLVEGNKLLKDTTKSDKGENLLPDGSEVVPTHEYFAFLINDEGAGTYDRVLVPMAKGQMQSSRKFLTMATSLVTEVEGVPRKPPLFFRSYRVKTAPKTNKNNQTWMAWDIEPGPALLPNSNGIEVLPYGERMYLEARAFKADADAGKVAVKPPVETDDGDHSGVAEGEDAPM